MGRREALLKTWLEGRICGSRVTTRVSSFGCFRFPVGDLAQEIHRASDNAKFYTTIGSLGLAETFDSYLKL